MVSLFKWLFGLILFLVLLVVAAVIVLPMVVDPNDFKPQIVKAAKDHLGRDLAIEQDLSLSVFPWLGIETGGVEVGNAPGFGDQPFARIEQLQLKVKLLPLLSRAVEVDTLVLNGLRLNLEKNASGKSNWEDLMGPQPAPADEPPPQHDTGGMPVSLSVQGIRIEDARITWDDRQSGVQYELDGVHLTTGTLAPGATVPVEAGVRFSSSQPAMTLDAGLEAQVSSDAELVLFRVADLVLKLDAAGEGLPSGGTKLTLNSDMSLDLKAQTLEVERLEVSGPAMAASATVSVKGLQSAPSASGKLSIAETNPKTLASMFASPLQTTDPEALTRASGELDFRYADGALRLDPLAIRLDDSTLSGHLHLLDMAAPVIRTELQLDQIDLDRYVPPAAEAVADSDAGAPAQAPTASGQAPAAAADDPFLALRSLDLVGKFTIGSLKVANARMRDVSTTIVSDKGVLKVAPMAAKLYEGVFDGSVLLDASSRTPKISTKQQLKAIQIGPLLEDLAGEGRLIGRGDLQADIRILGLSEAEIRRSLNGSASFSFRDGALKGINLASLIRDASNRLGLGGESLETGTPGQTDFSEMGASLTMSDGVIRNDDLQAKSPLLRVEGKGEVNLPDNTIDYLVVTELVSSLAGQGGKGRDELAGVPIPVRVSGDLTSPKYRPDLEAALSAKAKAQLDEKKEEAKQKVQEKIQEKLGDQFKGLFQ